MFFYQTGMAKYVPAAAVNSRWREFYGMCGSKMSVVGGTSLVLKAWANPV